MKIFFVLILFFVSTVSAFSQSSVLQSLSMSSPTGAVVRVNLDDLAAAAVYRNAPKDKVLGYRVCVFSDNSQSARAAAGTALSQLGQTSVPANVVYQNPFFKVYAGYCINRVEATMLLGRLKGIFPAAFIVGEQMPISIFERNTSNQVQDEPKTPNDNIN